MNTRNRLAIGAFAVLLLLIALFPPDWRNGWQFVASRHLCRIDWGIVGMEGIAALAVGLGVWAFAPNGKGEQ